MIYKSPGRPRKPPLRITQKTYRVCKNCPRKFQPTRDDHRFCGDPCRKEYHRHGHPQFGTMMDAILKEIQAVTAPLELRIAELERLARHESPQIDGRGNRTPRQRDPLTR